MPTFVKTLLKRTNMTDKEKIELIIQEKHLNSTQFCNEVCIAPGTLSHIRSGRTEPSLNILRSISQAFPDINPAWRFYGEGEMYRNSNSSSANADSGSSEEGDNINEEEDVSVYPFGVVTPSAESRQSPSKEDGGRNFNAASRSTANAPSVTFSSQASSSQLLSSSRSKLASSAAADSSSFSLQDVVAETIRQQQLPQRRVVEVRIFFDDGTFETFCAK